MIHITDKAKIELCEKLDIHHQELEFLGGGQEFSDGTVYTYYEQDKKKVLKVLAIPETEQGQLHKLKDRIKYANYIGEHGIKLAYPLSTKQGNLYEVSIDNGHTYVAYIMEFHEGKHPESSELTDELVYNWGKLTGKSHAITKAFTKQIDSQLYGYEEEIDFFMDWCKAPEIKEAWQGMKQYLSKLPRGIDDYGFIHNDNHQKNILINQKGITLIDFDCADKQFFMQDITTSAQGIMFDITGGMHSPFTNVDYLKHFLDRFIAGYETENHLEDKWYKELSTFINYRRMLLFTCMQGWLNTQPELKEGFIKTILEPPNFDI